MSHFLLLTVDGQGLSVKQFNFNFNPYLRILFWMSQKGVKDIYEIGDTDDDADDGDDDGDNDDDVEHTDGTHKPWLKKQKF